MPLKRNPEDQTDTRPMAKKKTEDSDEVKWNLAQGYLRSKDVKLARKVLTELANRPNSYTDRANDMLEKIK